MGDGCNMEGVSQEAASYAGHQASALLALLWPPPTLPNSQGLGKLICLYDDNHISIDGHTDISFTEARHAAAPPWRNKLARLR